MKTVEYYLNLPYRLEIVKDMDEGGFVASFPELRGCMTCGDTVEQAYNNAEDCKRQWIMAALEENSEIPEPASGNMFSGALE